MEHISTAILDIPGAFGDELRKAEARKAEYVAKHGHEAWEKRLADMKRKDDEEYQRKAEEQRSRLMIEKSGLASMLDEKTFETFAAREPWQKAMLDKCKEFLEQGEFRWMYISGQVGCGKTHLGTAVCGTLLKEGRTTRYTTYHQLMIELKAAVNDDEEYYRVLNEYGRAEALYIDDFMKFAPTEPDLKHTFELLNIRYVRGGVTIITSERSLNEICDIDGAIGSRIKQRCGDFAMDIARKDGRNWRLKGGES